MSVWKSCETLKFDSLIILGDIRNKRSPNFMIINIMIPNLLHGKDFVVVVVVVVVFFLFLMNY